MNGLQAQLKLKYNHYCIGKREGPCMTSIVRGDIQEKNLFDILQRKLVFLSLEL